MFRKQIAALKERLGLKKEYVAVYCHDSPGMIVLVSRNAWQRVTRPAAFSEWYEKQLPFDLIDRATERKLIATFKNQFPQNEKDYVEESRQQPKQPR